MKISDKTISALAKIITGDSGISPYKSGPQLVDFFNDIGANDVYGKGFPSRWSYAEEKLRQFNNTPKLVKVFTTLLDSRDFLQTSFEVLTVVDTLNEYLEYDGYQIVKSGKFYNISSTSDSNQLISNQGLNAPHRWNYLNFRSKTEIKIAEALDETGVLFLPNCKARLNTPEGRRNLEADFLVCYEGKWGILEVDGPHHTPLRRVEEQERERLFRHYRILIIERFDAGRCYNQPDGVVQEFLQLLKKA
jgi:hypothetical protein